MINMLKYLAFIILLFTIPMGLLYVFVGVLALMRVKEAYNVLHSLDVLAASWIHGTHSRTISGITGERAFNGSKVYKAQERIIDSLARLFGDDNNHCYRAWQTELGEE